MVLPPHHGSERTGRLINRLKNNKGSCQILLRV